MPLITMSSSQAPRSWGLPSEKPQHVEWELEATSSQWEACLGWATGLPEGATGPGCRVPSLGLMYLSGHDSFPSLAPCTLTAQSVSPAEATPQ